MAYRQQNSESESKSTFTKTITLYDWWLVKTQTHLEGAKKSGLAISGTTSTQKQALRLFSSAAIAKRYGVFTLETVDGMIVLLNTFINEHKSVENGFTIKVVRKFSLGFPNDWERYAGEDSATETTHNHDKGVVTTQPTLSETGTKLKEKLNLKSKDAHTSNEAGAEEENTAVKRPRRKSIAAVREHDANDETTTVNKLKRKIISEEQVSRLQGDNSTMETAHDHNEDIVTTQPTLCRTRTKMKEKLSRDSNDALTSSGKRKETGAKEESAAAKRPRKKSVAAVRENDTKDTTTPANKLKRKIISEEQVSRLQGDDSTMETAHDHNEDIATTQPKLSRTRTKMKKKLSLDCNDALTSNETGAKEKSIAVKKPKRNSIRAVRDNDGKDTTTPANKLKSEIISEQQVSRLQGDNSTMETAHDHEDIATTQPKLSRTRTKMKEKLSLDSNDALTSNGKCKETGAKEESTVAKRPRRKYVAAVRENDTKDTTTPANKLKRKIISEQQVCRLQGEESTTEMTHDHDEGVVTTQPTLSETGTKMKEKLNLKIKDAHASNGKRKEAGANEESTAAKKTKRRSAGAVRQNGTKDTTTPASKLKRKLISKEHETQRSQHGIAGMCVISPECLSVGRSRSGRILLPSLEFWRNQIPVYDTDRTVTGIWEDRSVLAPERGSRSEPREKRKERRQ